MRKLQRLSMAAVLTLTLTTYAFAGIIGGMPEPPPGTIETPPAPQASSANVTGIIGTVPSAQPIAPATDPVVDIALNLLQSVLSIF